ncbi:MAG: GNAT family N-acetyltransferase [Alphaproteobacteria bacterium]|nr:GNAT family N-acetyltransferase [Alphaproteobacteria bacterium]
MVDSSKDRVLNNAPMPITTPRLILRPLQPGDGPALHESKSETWDQLTKVFQWASGTPDPDLDEAYARRAFAKYILREDFNLVGLDKDTGEPVIYIGVHPVNWSLNEFQIGYWVRRDAQGQGYAKEASNALIRYTFNELGANRLVMCHVDGNEASRKIITSLGFDYEGLRRKSLVFAGNIIRDAHWYSRIDIDSLPDLAVNWG